MIGKFFDTSALGPFIGQVVAELTKSAPPSLVAAHDDRTAKRLEQADGRIRLFASNFAQSHGLNFYQKAKLGVLLQDALESAGYSEQFSRQFSYDVVKLVALATSRSH